MRKRCVYMSYLFSKNTEIQKRYSDLLTPTSEYVEIFKNLNDLEHLGFSDDAILKMEADLKSLEGSETPIGIGVWIDGDFKKSWSAAMRCLERRLLEIGCKLHNVFDVNDKKFKAYTCDVHRNKSTIDIVGLKAKLTPKWTGKNVKIPYPTMSVLWWLIFNVVIFKEMPRESPEDMIATGVVAPSIVFNGIYMVHICFYHGVVYIDIVPIDDERNDVIVHYICEIICPGDVDKPVCQ